MADEDGWTEIEGEVASPAADNFADLGQLLQSSPAFRQLLAKRATAARPVMRRETISMWDTDQPLFEAGSSTTDGVEDVVSDELPTRRFSMDAADVDEDRREFLVDLLREPPPFSAHIGRRRASTVPLQRARAWDLPFGPVYGPAGTTTTITVQPQCYFRGEKILATDSATPAGSGTLITQLLVGRKLQYGARGPLPTSSFSPNAFGSGLKMDTCQPAFCIAATVSFIAACTFSMSIFGKAII